ncbi:MULTISPECIES: FAD-dependent monooxygenase [Serratia]|nr:MULTISPECIES: FAD-dependent monooxygenase [Serratia]EMB6252203.1 FAD-dependent monooxygenase [Serratia marcescens]MBH2853445.1 FAD-dependent monooxygenase [Serratia marcescens]MBN5271267.1 FAD-dependent monooxygenase [Serratia marcescens]MBN5277313.1 FAD-dependent monooxygenase [Serratia marcescens]MBN5305216.1 FAD-dependent monooxygenase [Serratia marcescens]
MMQPDNVIGEFHYQQYPARLPPREGDRETHRHQVTIVGGGPVGLATALALARQGVASLILENDTQVCIGSRAACISRRSLEILDKLGVADAFIDKGLAWTRGRSFYQGEQVMQFDMLLDDNQQFPAMINLQQYYIEQFLLDEAMRNDDLIEIRWGSEVQRIVSSHDGVSVSVQAAGVDYRLETEWLLACDGGRSRMREQLGLHMQGRAHKGRFAIIDIELESETPAERRVWFETPLRPGPMWMHRQPDNIWRIDYLLEDNVSDEEGLKPENVLPVVEDFLKMVGETGKWRPIWISMYNAKALSLDEYRHGRVLFVGDAAHVVPIFGVRGLNGGLDDAYNLGWKLAYVLQGRAPEHLLDSYSHERRGAWRENADSASRSAEFMCPSTPGGATLRNAVLSLAARHPQFSSLINPRQTHSIRYADSSLNTPTNGDLPGPAVGAVLTEYPLLRDERPQALTGLLDARCFTLLRFPAQEEYGETTPPAQALQARYPLRIVTVGLPGRPRHGDAGDVEDPHGRLHTAYSTAQGALYLIRPDGHVCWRWGRDETAMTQQIEQALLRACGNPSGYEENTDER